jgi:hypothetical protein
VTRRIDWEATRRRLRERHPDLYAGEFADRRRAWESSLEAVIVAISSEVDGGGSPLGADTSPAVQGLRDLIEWVAAEHERRKAA